MSSTGDAQQGYMHSAVNTSLIYAYAEFITYERGSGLSA